MFLRCVVVVAFSLIFGSVIGGSAFFAYNAIKAENTKTAGYVVQVADYIESGIERKNIFCAKGECEIMINGYYKKGNEF